MADLDVKVPVSLRDLALFLLWDPFDGDAPGQLGAIDHAWVLESQDEAERHLDRAASEGDVPLVKAVLLRMLISDWLVFHA